MRNKLKEKQNEIYDKNAMIYTDLHCIFIIENLKSPITFIKKVCINSFNYFVQRNKKTLTKLLFWLRNKYWISLPISKLRSINTVLIQYGNISPADN